MMTMMITMTITGDVINHQRRTARACRITDDVKETSIYVDQQIASYRIIKIQEIK